ncbi:carboxymuconolactone decarboxylase family protein [Candidatus Poribacteria bacterium]|nr:carboxymuconolactone decarboxylase family protein [Candidatus Poribacteria bacterium]
MPTVRLVPESEATGKVREVFDDIKRTRGLDRVPNIWRALATNPTHLETSWERLKLIMADGALDRRTKEIIALAVSITNGCDYCINSHTAALQRLGLTTEGLGELIAVVDLFNAMNRVAEAYQIEPDVRPKVDP